MREILRPCVTPACNRCCFLFNLVWRGSIRRRSSSGACCDWKVWPQKQHESSVTLNIRLLSNSTKPSIPSPPPCGRSNDTSKSPEHELNIYNQCTLPKDAKVTYKHIHRPPAHRITLSGRTSVHTVEGRHRGGREKRPCWVGRFWATPLIPK